MRPAELYVIVFKSTTPVEPGVLRPGAQWAIIIGDLLLLRWSMKLHYEVQGEGHPLIILHGLFGSIDNWRTQRENLSRSFAVYALDLRNHGASPHSDVFTYAAMAEDLQEFLETQEISSAFVLGHSIAGRAAIDFALTHPERVDRLVVVDIALRAYSPANKSILEALLSLDIDDFRTRAEADAALQGKIPDTRVRQFLLKNLVRTKDGLWRWRMNLKGVYDNYERLCEPLEIEGQFMKPACFIRGGKSKYIEASDVSDIKKIFPSAEILTIPNASHWVHIDAPQRFTETVVDFLNRPAPDSAKG